MSSVQKALEQKDLAPQMSCQEDLDIKLELHLQLEGMMCMPAASKAGPSAGSSFVEADGKQVSEIVPECL